MKWSRSSSKKLLRVKVTSHESELEFDISPKSTGKYLFDLVCSTIGLRETWYFGLQNYILLSNGKMKLLHWLKLDKKIVSQKSTSGQTQFCFFFHTKFFPEDIEQELIQATTRHLFYLSVKAKILGRTETNVNGSLCGDLCPSSDVAILLASLAAQADFGDLCEDDLDGKDDPLFLPNRLLRLLPKQLIPRFQSDQSLAQKLKDCYKSYKGISRDRAELQYLKLAQAHHLFGVDYFPIICVRMKCPRTLSLARYFAQADVSPWRSWNKRLTNAWLGVTAAGIQLYGRNQLEKPRYTFQWNIIKNVSYRERKFTIKLVGSWRCHSKSNAPPAVLLATSFETVDKTVDSQSRSRHTSHVSSSGRSPLLGPTSGLGLTVGGGGSAATSAASLPSTPLSVRLIRPAVNSSCAELNVPGAITASPSNRFHRDASGERTASCRRTRSPHQLKLSGRTLDADSSCVPSLFPGSSSRCSTGDAPVVASGACLTTTKFQTTDSSAAGSSASSKGSCTTPHCSFMDHMISVVEVWLADPTQAKTVMSMCAGNHALFMRRRQPDSVEVQQMRAQAREERARREVERSRLARARAEKAEAVEARLALESRCAQLEQALICQQALLSGNASDTRGVGFFPKLTDDDSTGASRPSIPQTLPVNLSPGAKAQSKAISEGSHLFQPNTHVSGTLENGDAHLTKLDRSGVVGHETSKQHTVNNPVPEFRPNTTPYASNPWACPCYMYLPQTDEDPSTAAWAEHAHPLPSGYFGSASTPATPHAKRALHLHQTACLQPTGATSGFDSVFDVGRSVPCFGCSNPDGLYCPKASFNRTVVPNAHGLHQANPYFAPTCFPCDRHLPGQSRQEPQLARHHAPGSMPVLHNQCCTDEHDGDAAIPFNNNNNSVSWAYPQAPIMPPRSVQSKPPIMYATPGMRACSWISGPHMGRRMNSYTTNNNNNGYPPNHTRLSDPYREMYGSKQPVQLSTSLSAILSPVLASHRFHHPQTRLPGSATSVLDGDTRFKATTPEQEYYGSTPFLIPSTNPIPGAGYDEPLAANAGPSGDAPSWLRMNSVGTRGLSLQHLPESHGWLGFPPGDACVPVCPSHHGPHSRYISSTCGNAGGVPPVHPINPWPPSNEATSASCANPSWHNIDLAIPPDRSSYLSHCLQEERAKFAALQQQFSKQLFDTWACLRVTRSASGTKHNPATNTDLRVDPAGASDGASTGGATGATGVGLAGNGYAATGHHCSCPTEGVFGDCFGPLHTTDVDRSSPILLPQRMFRTDAFGSSTRSTENQNVDLWGAPASSFHHGAGFQDSAWLNTFNEGT